MKLQFDFGLCIDQKLRAMIDELTNSYRRTKLTAEISKIAYQILLHFRKYIALSPGRPSNHSICRNHDMLLLNRVKSQINQITSSLEEKNKNKKKEK